MVNGLRSMLIVAFVAGCGGNSVNGTVAGNSFSGNSSSVINGSISELIVITISSEGDVCADQQAGMETGNSSEVTITLGHAVNGLFTPGVYPIVTSLSGLSQPLGSGASFSELTSTCDNALSSAASNVTGGSVTVSSIELAAGGSVQGTFTFTVGSQADPVTGSFDAPFCVIPSGTSTTVCE